MWYEKIHITELGIFGARVQVWGLMLAIGVLAGWFLFDFIMLKKRIKFDSSWLVLGIVISGIIGARLLQVMIDYQYYFDNPSEIVAVWNGGLTSYGAVISISLFVWWYVNRYYKFERKVFWDAMALSAMLGLFFARVGCFLINDHIGKIASLPWSIYVLGDFRHPIALYYALNALVIFAVMMFLFIRKIWSGKLIYLTMIVYGLNRTIIDIWAKDFVGDNVRFWLTIILGCLLAGFGICLILRERKGALIKL